MKPSREIAFPFHFDATGGVATVTDLRQAYVNHIKVTLLTHLGERVMRPTFGSVVPSMLFENVDDIQAAELAIRVNDTLAEWVPEVRIHEVLPRQRNALDGVLEIHISFSIPPRSEVFTTLIEVGGSVREIES